MPRPFASKCAAALSLAACAAAAAHAAELDFDRVFATQPAASVHYEAQFTGRDGKVQTLEAWRDGDARLRRATGGALEILAQRKAGNAEYSMTVLDHQRKLLTRIDRTNLFRVGNFTDWFDLAHALKHPRGAYRLTAAEAPAGVEAPVASCRWFDLEQQGRTNHVCWSARAQLPLAIVDGSGRAVWRVTLLETGKLQRDAFRVDARDYIINDANAEMERD